jgi:hypothetical protein
MRKEREGISGKKKEGRVIEGKKDSHYILEMR